MRKIIAILMMSFAVFAMGMSDAYAGTVNGKITKIRAYEDGPRIRFESRVPNVDIIVRKIDIFKAMTKVGVTHTIVDVKRDGLIVDVDKKLRATLDRVGDGLHIRTSRVSMFISERELDDVRRFKR